MRVAAAVLVAGLVLSSCGADEERPAPVAAAAGMTRFTDERQGFEVTFPSDWMRADTVLTPVLTAPREILSVDGRAGRERGVEPLQSASGRDDGARRAARRLRDDPGERGPAL